MKGSLVLRITTIVVLSLTAAMTLLGAVGTTCVAFAAESFGPAMAPLVPVKPVFQLLVAVSLAAGIAGVVGIVRLARRAPRAFGWVLAFLVAGAIASGAQYWFSLTLRGSTAPNSMRLYLTIFALAWLLVLRLPGVWRRAGFDRTEPVRGKDRTPAGAAMVATGLLTIATPWWAAPTHLIEGVNTANALFGPLVVTGAALVLLGAWLGWGPSRPVLAARLPSSGRVPHEPGQVAR